MRRANDIPSKMIQLRLGVAQSYGLNPNLIIKEVGMDPEILIDPRGRISVDQTMAVWESIVKHSGHHYIGLDSGMKLRFHSLGILGYAMMNSTHILGAIQKLCRYQRLMASIVFQELQDEGEHIRIISKMQEDWKPSFRYTLDFVIAALYASVLHMTRFPIKPIQIGFNYKDPVTIDHYKRLFPNVQIEFGCKQSYLLYQKSDLKTPILGNDPELFQQFELQLEDMLDKHDQINLHSRSVKSLILNRLKAEVPRIDDVARELAMSVRSLQATLKEEKTSYQLILTSVRKELSIKHLKNPDFSITDVAFLLGFSDISVFSRNFKKWTGTTPSEYQKR